MLYDTRFILSLFVSFLISLAASAQETVEFDSTVVSSASYDKASQTLTILKVNEAEIVYGEVPEKVFKGLVEARLKGGYYRGFIEGEYEVVSKVEGDASIDIPSPVSTEPVDPAKTAEAVVKDLSWADSSLNKVRTAVPDVNDPRRKIAEATELVNSGDDYEEAVSLIREAVTEVRSLESRYAKELNDAETEKRTLELRNPEDNALKITRMDQLIDRLDPVVSDLRKASKALREAESSLKKIVN